MLGSLADILVGHQALTAGKNKLQAKVQKDLRKAKNSLRIARLQAAAATKKATMATQKSLPAFVAPSSLPAYVAPSALPGWLAPSSVPVHVPSPRSTELSWDPFVHREQPLSLQSVEQVIGDLGPATLGKQAQKATTLSAPVGFGSLPLVGDKKAKGDGKEEEMVDAGDKEEGSRSTTRTWCCKVQVCGLISWFLVFMLEYFLLYYSTIPLCIQLLLSVACSSDRCVSAWSLCIYDLTASDIHVVFRTYLRGCSGLSS